MVIKKCLSFVLLWSWLWLLGVVVPLQANGTVPEQPAPGVENRQQPPLPFGTDSQSGRDSNETNQRQPSAVSPDTDTEHDQQFCKSPEVIVASCEPTPGSPLSASPLV
ncbi:MAG TPA: hypothetical protein VGX03_14070 [Candidatus Binatia bacterium]|jgi:hypothetical protein|nr:hypothetical protein [Candidatus Binatia bacterium]